MTADDTVTMYPFHRTYPGTEPLFHTSCKEHPRWGTCGTRGEAADAIRTHLDKEHPDD